MQLLVENGGPFPMRCEGCEKQVSEDLCCASHFLALLECGIFPGLHIS